MIRPIYFAHFVSVIRESAYKTDHNKPIINLELLLEVDLLEYPKGHYNPSNGNQSKG